MTTEFGLKELYDVTIRTTYPIEVNGRVLEVGEVVGAFDKVQIANIQEIKNSVTARGGWDNRGFVFWDTTREIRISFVQGIFSKTQLAILSGAKLTQQTVDDGIQIPCREELESDESGIITLSHEAVHSIFVYDLATSDKLTYTIVDATHLQISQPFVSVLVDYLYTYDKNTQIITIGQPLTTGFLTLSGRSRIKDDITGQTHTVILCIPKLKLMSDLSMRLGQNAAPQIGRFDALAIPTGGRKATTEAMHMLFLEDDIDSDI